MIAKNIMRELGDIVTCGEDETVYSALVKMNEQNIGSVVIMGQEMNAKGIVTAHNIYRVLVGRKSAAFHLHLGDIMSSDLITVNEDDTIANCKRVLIDHNIQHLLVQGTEESIIGMLSSMDIISYEVNQEIQGIRP